MITRVTVNTFGVGFFLKLEDSEGGSSYMQCCIMFG